MGVPFLSETYLPRASVLPCPPSNLWPLDHIPFLEILHPQLNLHRCSFSSFSAEKPPSFSSIQAARIRPRLPSPPGISDLIDSYVVNFYFLFRDPQISIASPKFILEMDPSKQASSKPPSSSAFNAPCFSREAFSSSRHQTPQSFQPLSPNTASHPTGV